MSRWLVILVLSVASATAWAQPASLVEATTRAWNATLAAERQVAQAATRRNALATRFEDEIKQVEKLKSSRSWRRDRELREKLADADDLAKQLERANAELRAAQSRLAATRTSLVSAIDTELAARPAEARKNQLVTARAQVVPQIRKAHRIVLPDMQINPLSAPDELDQQAAALRQSETELQAQVKGLEVQAKDLEQIAILRKHSERTQEMNIRDENNSRRTSNPNTRSGGDAEASQAPPTDRPTTDSGGSSFEMDASITLAEVVDPTTLESLKVAGRSNDPEKRAAAARRARDAVQKKLDQLRNQRKQVEERARQLRK
jgi:hypothetical protein